MFINHTMAIVINFVLFFARLPPVTKLPTVRILRIEPTLLAGELSVVRLLAGVDCPLDRFAWDAFALGNNG